MKFIVFYICINFRISLRPIWLIMDLGISSTKTKKRWSKRAFRLELLQINPHKELWMDESKIFSDIFAHLVNIWSQQFFLLKRFVQTSDKRFLLYKFLILIVFQLLSIIHIYSYFLHREEIWIFKLNSKQRYIMFV